MIRITVNGKPREAEGGMTAAALMKAMGYKGKTSVWVNGRQLLLAEYDSTVIGDGDEVKLLRVIGGG